MSDNMDGKKKYDDDEYLEPSDPIIEEAEEDPEDLLDEEDDDELADYDENDEEDRAHLYRRRKGYSWEEDDRHRRKYLDEIPSDKLVIGDEEQEADEDEDEDEYEDDYEDDGLDIVDDEDYEK
jgi:hypothetical protein